MSQEPRSFDVLRLLLETLDEGVSDPPPFLLRFDHAAQGRQEAVRGIDHMQIGVEVIRKLGDHRLLFPLAQQAVVHEDARQPGSDRFGQEGRRDRRVDSAGESADDSRRADLVTQPVDRLPCEIAQQPIAFTAADQGQEIVKDRTAQRCVRDLRMKLQPENRQPAMPHRGVRARVRAGQRYEIIRDTPHLIAVAHPDIRRLGQPGKQIVVIRQPASGSAVFPSRRAVDLSAQGVADQLHAVADSQNGNPLTRTKTLPSLNNSTRSFSCTRTGIRRMVPESAIDDFHSSFPVVRSMLAPAGAPGPR